MNESSELLKFQFDSLRQQRHADSLGMWVFLATEVLFFGGLFLVYAVYRWSNPDAFIAGSRELDLPLGTVNTAILLTSSMTVALAEWAVERERRRLGQWMLAATLLLGLVFLGSKFHEYSLEYRHQLIPFINESFSWDKPNRDGGKLFFNTYFAMTGLHALHLIIGCGMVATLLLLSRRRRVEQLQVPVKMGALYWHFVDIVWVFLFPLLYLAR